MNRDEFTTTPHSVEAEHAVLGALMLDNGTISAMPRLSPDAFYVPMHGQAYGAILKLSAASQPFDTLSVYEQMRLDGTLPEGGLSTLNSMTQVAPSPRTLRRHAEVIGDLYARRQLLQAGNDIRDLALEGGSFEEQANAAQMLLSKLTSSKVKARDPQHVTVSLADYLQHLDDLSEGLNPAMATGLGGLDSILNGGLRRGEMMVIGARPKHGKTALSLSISRHMARSVPVCYLSQEMPVRQLMHRHTAALGSVDLGRILAADKHDAGMWEGVANAAHRLSALNLIHDDQCALSLLDIRRKAMKVKREHGLGVLVVDFLQLMQSDGKAGDNRNQELDVISNGLKALAMELDIGVILLSQMNRKADETYGAPVMSHLRDSGAIEAAADQIALLFTDHSHPMSKKESQFAGYSQLEIVAHRNGAQGVVPLHFVGKYQQFGDWTEPMPSRATKTTSRGL
jgi:replicative DNA helicase